MSVLRDTCLAKRGAPYVHDMLDSLQKQLPSRSPLPSSDARGITSDSKLIGALAYSIANGFVGMQDIRVCAVLEMVKRHPQLSSQLFGNLQNWPPAAARQLANNLFRAAVEACDAPTLTAIIQTMKARGQAIKPNEIICELKGRRYTPVEVAAGFQNFEVLQILTDLEADVNKTYHNGDGALGIVLGIVPFAGGWRQVDIKIIRLLLKSGSEIFTALVMSFFESSAVDLDVQLPKQLIEHLPNAHHDGVHSLSGGESLLATIASRGENEFATTTIQGFFEDCESSGCSTCATNLPDISYDILVAAAERDNQPLCEFLLDFTQVSPEALSAAIRTCGNSSLTNLFLQQLQGATSQPLAAGRDTRSRDSPLAEAIRREEYTLAQRLESLGAWTAVETRSDHLLHALRAAAEVGNLDYLGRLQEILPHHPEKQNLEVAGRKLLEIAMDQGHTTAALALIDAGVHLQGDTGGTSDHPLRVAVMQENNKVIDALLESDIPWEDCPSATLKFAAGWGGIRLAEELIDMGFLIRTDTLVAAVAADDVELVRLLLRKGADPCQAEKSKTSPLREALVIGNREMAELLFSTGADPADLAAFLFAVEEDVEALGLLLDAFSKRYPNGRGNFGADIFIKAIECKSMPLLVRLLATALDVNSYSSEREMTPLGFAILGGEESLNHVRTLLAAGADPNAIAAKPDWFRKISWPLYPATALHVAIHTRSLEMVVLLLGNKAVLNRPARRGLKRTPLQQACETGSIAIIEHLLKCGARVNDPPARHGGGTALQLAAINGSAVIVTLLLEYGANLHAAPSVLNGRTALEGAAEHGRFGTLELLWQRADGRFEPREVERAQKFARANGNPACADYLADLSAGSHQSLRYGLSMDTSES